VSYKVTFAKSAIKELQKLPKKAIQKIAPSIDALESDPRPSGCKKMQSVEANLYRIRVGDYRIIYKVEDEIQIVHVRKIGHRRDVYRL
jgi:mRNA interferase RelE/StbE